VSVEIRIRRHQPDDGEPTWRGVFVDDGLDFMWLESPDKCVVAGMAKFIARNGPSVYVVVDECPEDWPDTEDHDE
jgi:hypothetical protein